MTEAEREHMERMIEHAKAEAWTEYKAHKLQQKEREEQEECPHDEHDHGICLECGKDIMDDLIGRAELLRDDLRDDGRNPDGSGESYAERNR